MMSGREAERLITAMIEKNLAAAADVAVRAIQEDISTPWPPPSSPGSPPHLRTGDLRGSIGARKEGDGVVVGMLDTAQTAKALALVGTLNRPILRTLASSRVRQNMLAAVRRG